MSTFNDLYERHNDETYVDGLKDGWIEGFERGVHVMMNFIIGWRGEDRNPDREVALEEFRKARREGRL